MNSPFAEVKLREEFKCVSDFRQRWALGYRYMTPFWLTERNLLLPAFFYSKDRSCRFFRNVCFCVSSYMVFHNGSP